MSAGRKREQIILKILLPAVHGIVAEGHFVCVVAFIPFRVAVGEHHILTFAVNLPVFRYGWIRRAAYAILRVIILVRVLRIKLQSGAAGFGSRRVAAQDKSRGNKIEVLLTGAKPCVAPKAALQPLK